MTYVIEISSDREDSDQEKILIKKIKYKMCLYLYLKNFE